jgi:ParB-like nuclease domain
MPPIKSSRLKKPDISDFFVRDIKVGYENGYIYEPCGIDNQDDRELVDSIDKNGIQEPLILSADSYLLSGHRRLWAAKRLKMDQVPVRRTVDTYELLAPVERLNLLRRHNRQREKSYSEKLREISLDLEPEKTYNRLQRRRIEQLIRPCRQTDTISLGKSQKRSRITTLKFLEAVKKIVFKNKEYWPLTDRRIHYLLLNDPPPRHDKKPDRLYRNDSASYKALTDLLTRARLTGDIPIRAIDDPTRPISLYSGYDNAQEFFKAELEDLLSGYSRNLMQGQYAHIEILLEKAALKRVVELVAMDYCIPVTTTRGYSSLTPRHEISQRFRRSGKKQLVLLILADFDPDGEEIAASLARSMRDDFGIPEFSMRAIKVGLTHEDVFNNDFPSELEAKLSSPNYKKFVDKFGERVVELDAAPVEWIQEKLRAAIEAELDMDEFTAQTSLEREDSVKLEAQRRLVYQALELPYIDNDD